MRQEYKDALMFSGPLFYVITLAALFGCIAYMIWDAAK